MIVRANFTPAVKSLAEVIHDLGDIPLERIRAKPAPGSATEEDLLKADKPVCELIDGVLVEKPVGDRESLLAAEISALVRNRVRAEDLGVVLGADGYFRLSGGQVRAPDVSFTPWSSFPDEEIPEEAYWSVAPALFVEVLSPKNTVAEIDRKLREFFAAGSQLAWVIDPKTRTAKVYTTAKRFKVIASRGTLDGGKVLPGFTLPLADLFAITQRRKKK
jgi:Uma2 family endonuclease